MSRQVLSPAECVERLNAMGVSDLQIAKLLKCHRMTVVRATQGAKTDYHVVDRLRELVVEHSSKLLREAIVDAGGNNGK